MSRVKFYLIFAILTYVVPDVNKNEKEGHEKHYLLNINSGLGSYENVIRLCIVHQSRAGQSFSITELSIGTNKFRGVSNSV